MDLPGVDRRSTPRHRAAHPPTDRHRLLGAAGEAEVAKRYASLGYRVLDRNWRCALGELDLVLGSQDGSLVAFCEVKSRSGAAFGHPLEAVTARKALRLRRLAVRWLVERRPPLVPRPATLRFDVAAVMARAGGFDVEIVTGAF